MNKLIYGAVLVTALAVLAGCSAGPAKTEKTEKGTESTMADGKTEVVAEEKAEYIKITAQDAKNRIDEGGVTVVDVRTLDEYEEGHIAGAVVVPVESIGEELPKELPDLDAVLLVHCRSGVRSKAASEKLIDLGYKNVYDFGGIKDWTYETVKGAD